MYPYEDIYHMLGMPDAMISCALGRVRIPIAGWVSPPEWYVFPPALVPIWSNGSGPEYLACWKHWFSNRELTFVEMYVESGYAVEIARTAEQLFCYVAMTALGIHDDITPRVAAFADAVGILNLSDLNAVSLRTGDDPLGFSVLPQFADDLPLSSVRDSRDYSGSFPSGSFLDSREWWNNACSFELSRETMLAWPENVLRPPWLLSGDMPSLFDRLLSKGDLHGAWLTLNSTGWTIPQAKTALWRLVHTTDHPELARLASAWSAVADPSIGGY